VRKGQEEHPPASESSPGDGPWWGRWGERRRWRRKRRRRRCDIRVESVVVAIAFAER